MCSDLPSTTRLVLHTLAAHMDSSGGSCFPSTATVAEESGLSKRVVIHHIKLAVENGWIIKGFKGVNGQGWKRHKYQAAIPGEENTRGNKKVSHSRKSTRRKHRNDVDMALCPYEDKEKIERWRIIQKYSNLGRLSPRELGEDWDTINSLTDYVSWVSDGIEDWRPIQDRIFKEYIETGEIPEPEIDFQD